MTGCVYEEQPGNRDIHIKPVEKTSTDILDRFKRDLCSTYHLRYAAFLTLDYPGLSYPVKQRRFAGVDVPEN